MHRVAAVDLGATSVRVAVVDLDAPGPEVEVVHRVPHGPQADAHGTLRWDWTTIIGAVDEGLAAALAAGPLASIGVDGWGVDHALLDGDGELLAPPVSYRDRRTDGWQQVADRLGRDRLYDATGIQLMPINTIFQLAAHPQEELQRSARIMLLPDLVVRHLTAVDGGTDGAYDGTERSNASTTALLRADGADWVPELLEAAGVRQDQLATLQDAGSVAGSWNGVPVHLVGSHDTASAFVARPGPSSPGSVVVSAGTWVLVGAERPAADTGPAARAGNFANERGTFGGVRFLRNVVGFWLLERCRAAWGDPPVPELLEAAAAVDTEVPVFDATDERFLAPEDMEAEIRAATGLAAGTPRGVIVASILTSIAAATAEVVAQLGAITGDEPRELHLVGGGVRNELMNQLLADRTGLPVLVGSPEATALGNAVTQGVALGRFRTLEDARAWVATAARRLEPRGGGVTPAAPSERR